MSNCEVVTFPLVGQVWCLIVSIPDLRPFSYLSNSHVKQYLESDLIFRRYGWIQPIFTCELRTSPMILTLGLDSWNIGSAHGFIELDIFA